MALSRGRALAIVVAAGVCVGSASQGTKELSVVDMLDRYSSGKFESVVTELAGDLNFVTILKQLEEKGPAWIEAAGPAAREKRRVAAATLALEAARADEWYEWKWIVRQPAMDEFQPLNVLYWKPPPLLIEWACKLMRSTEAPVPIERWWHLAAIAVAQRSEDVAFLVGDPAIGRGVGAGEIINIQDEIKHLEHASTRFPNEMRFRLAEGIARDRMWQDDASQAYGSLANDIDVGGEAMMRMGVMQYRGRRSADALKSFDRADSMTRDPYVVYLSSFVRGRILESQERPEQAMAAYQRAVAALPHGQAATLALASLLFQDGRRLEAQELAVAMFAADPLPLDPWRDYVHADDRFWPLLIGKLRAEILK
jgi:tetratricopeptide (TPR) repeat protein